MNDLLLRYDNEKTFVFIDCETFNLCLNSCHNLPWQVAMLKVKGSEIISSKDFYIKWDTKLKIGKEAARITKFNQTKFDKRCLTPEEVFPTIKDWLSNADYIVGHNVLGFDIYLIRDYFKKMKESYHKITDKVVDTYALAKGIKLNEPYNPKDNLMEYQYRLINKRARGIRTNLASLGKEYKIDHNHENLHDALVDLELNLKVWNKLKWQVEI
jgi:DNA polymerase III epsilon subunit-like protein